MNRYAQCACGALKAETRAEPEHLIICHCVECQRRTGSVFGAGAYFKSEDVVVSGPNTTYVRIGTTGGKVEMHFCPTCGSTVYWYPEAFAGITGVTVGAFADPHFPAPRVSAWEHARHDWVKFEHEMVHLPQGRPR